MKKLDQFLIIIILLISVVTCKKNDNKNKELLNKETISAKWLVTGNSDYKSFEFNKSGNYIIVKNNITKSTNSQIVLFGTYKIIDDKTVTFSDFGTLEISDIKDNNINFSIALNSTRNELINISATKQSKISNSTKTKLLCKTWELVAFRGIAFDNFIIVFSDAGTYYASSLYGSGIGNWQWCDPDESKLAFIINDSVPDCNSIRVIKNIVLTDNSFSGIDLENGQEDVFVMKPVSNTKSARVSEKKTEIRIFGIRE